MHLWGINVEQQQLKRELKNRHVQLIAIGGTIGTGLFLGSGKAIALAGPSIILAYLIVGTALFLLCVHWANYYYRIQDIHHLRILPPNI